MKTKRSSQVKRTVNITWDKDGDYQYGMTIPLHDLRAGLLPPAILKEAIKILREELKEAER
jgi:hypothetical protein